MPRWLFWSGTAVLVLPALIFGVRGMTSGKETGMILPRPFALTVDDLGWIRGHNSGALDGTGPFRLGLDRRMEVSDYRPLVEIGRALNIRLQGAFILAEMDRENLLRRYPTTTAGGSLWDNSENVGPEQLKLVDFLREEAAFLEFGLHGVGHEFWPEPGVRRRGEWYDMEDDSAWSPSLIANHVEAIKGILAQYGLSKEEGHSFPESFVPGANAYHWNPAGEHSTGALLRPEGVRFASTTFQYVEELHPPSEPNSGGIDHGLLVLNRMEYGNVWYGLSSPPTVPLRFQESDVVETHWNNFLAQDDFLQDQATRAWIEFLRKVQESDDRYLAKNTEQLASQWLYRRYATVVEEHPGRVVIDNSAMPSNVYRHQLLGTLVLKVRLPQGSHLSKALLEGAPITVYQEAAGFGFIHLPRLEPKEYELTYEFGGNPPSTYIDHTGTYNVYSTELTEHRFRVQLRMYGTQEIRIHGIPPPSSIVVDNEDLSVLSSEYSEAEGVLVLMVSARDIQGETGTLRMEF